MKRKQFSDANAVVVAFANLNISSKFIEFINRWRWVDSARATVASEIIGDDEDQIISSKLKSGRLDELR